SIDTLCLTHGRVGHPGPDCATGLPDRAARGRENSGDNWRVHRVTVEDAARMRALRLEMLADNPLAFLETLAQAAARPHEAYRRRIAQAAGRGEGAPVIT